MQHIHGDPRSLLEQLPDRGWTVVREPDQLSLIHSMILKLIKVQRAGPGAHVYQVRLTAAGRQFLRDHTRNEEASA